MYSSISILHLPKNLLIFRLLTKKNRLNENRKSKQATITSPFHPNMEILGSFIG